MRKVANLRRLLGMVVTAIQAGRSVYHNIMLGQAKQRVKHDVCQFCEIAGPEASLRRFSEFQAIPVAFTVPAHQLPISTVSPPV